MALNILILFRHVVALVGIGNFLSKGLHSLLVMAHLWCYWIFMFTIFAQQGFALGEAIIFIQKYYMIWSSM